jgi:hypothetical protein
MMDKQSVEPTVRFIRCDDNPMPLRQRFTESIHLYILRLRQPEASYVCHPVVNTDVLLFLF